MLSEDGGGGLQKSVSDEQDHDPQQLRSLLSRIPPQNLTNVIAVGRLVAQAAPAQIPACPFRAPGSSEALVSVSGIKHGNPPVQFGKGAPGAATHVGIGAPNRQARPRNAEPVSCRV